MTVLLKTGHLLPHLPSPVTVPPTPTAHTAGHDRASMSPHGPITPAPSGHVSNFAH